MIEKINHLPATSASGSLRGPVIGDQPMKQKSFKLHLKQALQHVDQLQKQADVKTEQLIKGEITDLHDVMITAQKASLTLETTVQIQRKVIDAYNEIMRMQI